MSMPVALEHTVQPSLRRRAAARPAVALARLLVCLPPRRLRRALHVARRGARPATHAEALAARQAVVAVSVQCAGQGCLQRSVATALLCRLGGVWPEWCTGVLTEPFRAHAWVEVGGHPVGERDDIRGYHKVMTVPPEVWMHEAPGDASAGSPTSVRRTSHRSTPKDQVADTHRQGIGDRGRSRS